MRQISPSTLLMSSLVYLASHMSILNPFVEVKISQGILRGAKSVSRDGSPFLEFLSIPYARPPIGELRFEPPQPPENWTGFRFATNYGPSCIQYEFLTHLFTGSEDCLTLNVFTHQVLTDDQLHSSKVSLKPVIVFLYGGLFQSGFSFIYRAKYFMDHPCVLVTFNYRVSSLGFLNTGDHIVRGNMGLKDQTMALKWVKENIKYFGGDASRVTIMGNSAGAASTHYHLLSNMSKGLFHRAISQSGTALQSWAFSKYPKLQAQRLGRNLNCPIENSRVLVDCLRSRTALAITDAHREYLDPIPDPLALFSPSIEAVEDENTFLSQSPIDILRNGNVANKVPWIVGVNSGEGLLGAAYLTKKPHKLKALDKEWEKYAPILFRFKGHPNQQNITKKIRNHYFHNKSIDESNFKNIGQLYSDSLMYWKVDEAIKLHSKVAPVYPYFFDYHGNSGLTNILIRMAGGRMPRIIDFVVGASQRWMTGKVCRRCIDDFDIAHSDELVFQFNLPVIAEEIIPGSEDYPFSKAFMELWMSFVKDGKPANFLGLQWDPVDAHESNTPYLKLNIPPESLINPFKNISNFWDSLHLKP